MAIKTLSFGPKEFLPGISPLQNAQNSMGGFFAQASGVDLYRYPGMIAPGPNPTSVGSVSAAYYSIATVSNATAPRLFALSATGITDVLNSLQTHFFAANAGSGRTAPSVSLPHNMAFYRTNYSGSAQKYYLFYFTDGQIGRYNLNYTFSTATNWNDEWGQWGDNNGTDGTGHAPAGNNALSTAIHRCVVFNQILYFTNGIYIGTFDGNTGVDGTLNVTKFVLPDGYTAQDIRMVKGRLELYISNGVQTKIGIWDGVSTLAEEYIDVDDNNVLSANVLNGFPYVLTLGRGLGLSVRRKNFYGYPQTTLITGTDGTFGSNVNPSTVDNTNGMITIGDTGTNQIYTYGSPFPVYSYYGSQGTNFPDALQSPYLTTGSNLGAIAVYNKLLYAASSGGGSYYLETFNLAKSGTQSYNKNASFKTNFIELPHDAVIEWIRFVVLPPAAGAAFTPTLYNDYSTSPLLTLADLTSSNLDANGQSKTYFDIGKQLNNFAIGGSWANSSTSNSVIISRIDVGYSVK